MKAPSWKKLIHLVQNWELEEYLDSIPAEWQAPMALACSVAKWMPSRGDRQGEGECGLCTFYDNYDYPADHMCHTGPNHLACPLLAVAGNCNTDKSVYSKFLGAKEGTAAKKKYAMQMYSTLMKLYKEEYNR